MSARDVFNKLRHLDAYPKTLEEFRVKTFAGATVTILSALFILTLFLSELRDYLTVETKQELFVDTSRDQKIKININVVFPFVPCHSLSIDAMDISGEQQQSELEHHLFKQRLDKKGNRIMEESPTKSSLGDPSKGVDLQQVMSNSSLAKVEEEKEKCLSCYGAETRPGQCCNTCDEVRAAYRKKGWALDNMDNVDQCKGEAERESLAQEEGCQAFGHLLVNKVAGNFHFAPGKSFVAHHVHIHDLGSLGGKKFNLTHKINHLSFGDSYPGILNPLDSTYSPDEKGSTMTQYYVKIVPTTYHYLKSPASPVYTNQYSVTKHEKQISLLAGDSGLPGVFFMYEFSPMMVKVSERAKSFLHFLTSLCAIVGGVFTVAGLLDAALYHSAKYIQKNELGKLG